MVGYTQSSVVHWGGSLKTKIVEEGVDQDDDIGTAFQYGKQSTQTGEYQFFAVKLGAQASKTESPSCLETSICDNGAASPTIKTGSCFIDNVCYPAGETAEIFGRSCLVSDPSQSQSEWSYSNDVGVNSCFIDNVCYDKGDAYSYRKSRSEIIESECQVCEPSMNHAAWSVKPGFQLANGFNIEPPSDCLAVKSSSEASSSLRPSTPVNDYESLTFKSSKSGLSNGAKIGIGIIVPLVLILAALITARYCARKGTGIEK